MEQLNRNVHGAEGAQSCQQIYGGMEYGSIMALVTQQQQQQQQSHEPNSSSYSSYSCHQHHHHNNSSTEPECMLSEAAARMVTASSDRMVTGCSSRTTMMGIGQLVSSEDVKDEDGKDNVKNSVNPPLVVTPALAHSTGKSLHIQEEDPDVIRAKIMAHVHYPRLLTAYLECQKIGAPPSVLSELETLHQNKCQRRQYMSTISIGVDPELDQFMEAYCELFVKYKEELTRPFKEATEFLKKVEMQLSAITKDHEPLKSLGEGDGGTGSSEEEEDGEGDGDGDGDAMESIHRHTHGHGHGNPLAEDRALKEQLLRKYSGYLSGLKQEFLKKKKKGKLPKEARQKLLDWWTSHYKWPYPSEAQKIALAEATGLDQKQINNWFINQRKRHWKPSEEMQFVVMETPATRHHPHPHIFHLAPDGNPHQTFSMSMDC